MNQEKAILLFNLMLYSVLYSALILFNPNHYTTVDSHYYLDSALHLKNGFGYTIAREGGFEWNTHFPPLYSIFIAMLSSLTGVSVLMASKILNGLIAIAIVLVVHHYWRLEKAIFTSFLLLSGTVLKVFVHTWSEGLFLLLLLVTYLMLEQNYYWSTFIGGALLIATRFAGVFLIPYLLWKAYKTPTRRFPYLLLATGWSLLVAVWAGVNTYHTGYAFGETRFLNPITIGQNTWDLLTGLLNQLLLFRKYRPADGIVWLAVAIQVTLVVRYWRKIDTWRDSLQVKTEWLPLSLTYLVTLFVLRQWSPFSSPDSRLLLPFTWSIGMHIVVITRPKMSSVRTYQLTMVLVWLSWLELLPTGDWLSKFRGIFQL